MADGAAGVGGDHRLASDATSETAGYAEAAAFGAIGAY